MEAVEGNDYHKESNFICERGWLFPRWVVWLLFLLDGISSKIANKSLSRASVHPADRPRIDGKVYDGWVHAQCNFHNLTKKVSRVQKVKANLSIGIANIGMPLSLREETAFQLHIRPQFYKWFPAFTGCLHTMHGETTLPSFSASVIGFLKCTVYLLEITVLCGGLKINQYISKIWMCVEEA